MNMKYLTLLSSLSLVACATGSNQHLHHSLQPYIGQTAAQVRSQLDLRAMGFKPPSTPFRQQTFSVILFSGM
jgi:Tfp pilus assembly protein PilP